MNHAELEDRLRSAYRARAELVTAGQLSADPPDLATDQPRVAKGAPHRTFLAPLLAAAAVVLLAVGAVVVAHFANDKAAPADRLQFTTPQVKTWGGVGPGWTVALWAPTPTSAQNTVYLVSPAGKRRAVMTVRGRALGILDWSADRSRVLLGRTKGSGARWEIVVLDLRSASQQRWDFSGWFDTFYRGFASPDGSQLILDFGKTVRTLDDTGHVVATRPATAFDDPHAFRATMNGRPVAIAAAHRRGAASLTVSASDGSVLAQLPSPRSECSVIRPWDAGSLLTECADGFWQVPLDGGAPVRLVRLYHYAANPPQGLTFDPMFNDLYEMNGTLYATSPPGCGSHYTVWRIRDHARPQLVEPIGGVAVGGLVSGVADESFYFLSDTGSCQGIATTTLMRFSPAQNRVTPLLGDGANGGTVQAAITDGLLQR